jgi:hypothetical protein
MAREQADLPEELHGGMSGGKLRRNKLEDQLEAYEQDTFKRAVLSKDDKKRINKQGEQDFKDNFATLDDDMKVVGHIVNR